MESINTHIAGLGSARKINSIILTYLLELGRCNESWVNFDKSCYFFVSDSPQTWVNARDVCRQGLNTSINSDLVTVDDR